MVNKNIIANTESLFTVTVRTYPLSFKSLHMGLEILGRDSFIKMAA